MREIFSVATIAALCLCVSAVRAADEPPPFAEPRDDSSQYAVETVVAGLDNPAGIAIRPGPNAAGPFEVFVSESGAGRVVRFSTATGEPTPVITGFPVAPLEADPAIHIGPLGLDFISSNRLVVGTGGLGVGADVVRVYDVSGDDAPVDYERLDHAAGPIAKSGKSSTGEGAFFSIAHSDDALFVVPHHGDERGWVLRATLEANRLAGLEPFIAVRETAGVGNPSCAVIDPRAHHHYLVVASRGEPTNARDSRVTMYSPTSGTVALNLATGLYDVKALAYSPSGDLYAVDFAAEKADEGGVFRLEAATVDGRESCRAVKIAAAVHPTALAFARDGSLYVTAVGDYEKAGAKPHGAVLKISPLGDAPKL